MKTNLRGNRIEENPSCALCGKTFCSIKALHGHMRSHPDRPWRGIQPPTPTPAAASWPRWSLTAKRGRKSASTSASSSTTVSDDQVVVNSLMFLSKSEDSDDHHRSPMNMGDLVNYSNPHIGIPIKLEQKAAQELNCEMGSSGSSSRNSCRKISTRAKKINKIQHHFKNLSDSLLSDCPMQLNPTPTPTPTPTPIKKLYRCNSCNKDFSSHQALGGHKSSHNKTNYKTVATTTSFDSTSFDSTPTTLQINKRRILDFDLNELPPMDDDGQAAVQCV